jgi:hypothetical protein
MAEHTALPVPIYSIYNRDIPRVHLGACIIVNPTGPAPKDKRETHEATVAGCEGDRCKIPSREVANG